MPTPAITSSASATAVDISRLPPPDVVEALDYETILAAAVAEFRARFPEFSALVESDPAFKLLEVFAYREMLLRQRVNEAARAVMPAFALGGDLDNLAALVGVVRRTLQPANPETGAPAVLESDDDLRRRFLLAPDSFSLAGPTAAYVFHALTADGRVRDASATSPAPGDVVVAVLSTEGDGTASPALLAIVEAAVGADDVRPLTDRVTVQSADIVPFAIDARLTLYPGPTEDIVLAAANARLADLLAENRRIGRDVSRSALFAALHVPGVQKIDLVEPAADIVLTDLQAGNATPIAVTVAGFAE